MWKISRVFVSCSAYKSFNLSLVNRVRLLKQRNSVAECVRITFVGSRSPLAPRISLKRSLGMPTPRKVGR